VGVDHLDVDPALRAPAQVSTVPENAGTVHAILPAGALVSRATLGVDSVA